MIFFYLFQILIIGYFQFIFSRIVPGYTIVLLTITTFFFRKVDLLKFKKSFFWYWAFLVCIWILGFFSDLSSSWIQFSSYLILMSVYILFLSRNIEHVNKIHDAYRFFIIFMSISLVLSALNFYFKIIPVSWELDLRHLGMHLYTLDFFGSLILTNVDSTSSMIFNFEYYRLSGFSEEPAWASLMIGPVLLYELGLLKKTMCWRVVIILILFTAFFITLSITSIIALSITYIFYVFFVSQRMNYSKIALYLISIVFIISWIYFKLSVEFNEGGFLYAKLSEEADTRNITAQSIDLSFNNWLYSMLSLFSLFGTLFLFSYLLKALFKSKKDALYAVLLLFILIHNSKRGFLYLMIDPLTFFYFALLYSSLVSQERRNRLKFA